MKERKLNIELLRIFAIFLIIIWHIEIHFMRHIDPHQTVSRMFMSYAIVFIPFHVNLFVLITGYFGIRNNVKNILRNIILIYFYSILLNLLSYGMGDDISLKEMFMPLSHGPWWFMQIYILLLFVAPCLESYVKTNGNCTLRLSLSTVLFVNVYLSYFNGMFSLTNAGYDIVNFLCLYIIGMWIRIEGERFYKQLKYKYVFLIVNILVLLVFQYKLMGWELPIGIFDYNSIYAIGMAICIFLLFSGITISHKWSKIILFFSSSSVASYLITDFPGVRDFLVPIFSIVYKPYQYSISGIGIIFLWALLLFIGCVILDKIRIPITEFICGKLFDFLKLQPIK